MRELVRGSDNKTVEGIFRVQGIFNRLEVQPALTWRIQWSNRTLLDDVNDIDVADTRHLRGLQYDVNVIVQPVLKVDTRNAYVERTVIVLYELSGFEPRIKA